MEDNSQMNIHVSKKILFMCENNYFETIFWNCCLISTLKMRFQIKIF